MRYLMLYFSCLLAVGPCMTPAANALTLVDNGQANTSIITPDEPDATTTEAAATLQDFLKRSTGAALPVVGESQWTGNGPAFFVGPTRAARDAGLSMKDAFADSYLIKVDGQRVFLLGRDHAPTDSIPHYIAAKGTLRAVIGFLEKFVGVRWLIPTPAGVHIPKHETVQIDDDFELQWRPVFSYVTGRLWTHGLWSQANNYRNAIRIRSYGGHSWDDFIPESLFETQPDLFNMTRDGKRALVSFPGNRMYCGSNPKTVQMLIDGVRKVFDEGYDVVELAVSDGYIPCRCQPCESLDNYPDGPCERIHIPHRKVAEALLKSHPNKRVMLIAYPPVGEPPASFDKYPENTWIQLATGEAKQWRGKVSGFTRYAYVWGMYHLTGVGPSISPQRLQANIKQWRDEDVTGIYFCGGDYNWGAEGPTYYIVGRLLSDPDQPIEPLLAEYCNGLYGGAAPIMKEFFEMLYARVDGHQTLESLPGNYANQEALYTLLYPPNVLKQLQTKLDLARQTAEGDERAQQWINLSQRSLTYLKDMSDVFHLFRAYQTAPGHETLTLLRDAVNKRQTNVKKMEAEAKDAAFASAWFPGANRFGRYAAIHGKLQGTLTGPFAWDYDMLLAKKMYPGKSRMNVDASSITQPPVIDGIIDDPAWGTATWHELGGVSMGKAEVRTRYAVSYDQDNLYFAAECAEPQIDKMRLSAYERDGKVWRNECVELFLDPDGLEQKFMHLILSPVESAYYDARTGYITDPLHPLVHKPDPAWDPQWSYSFQIDSQNQQWTVEVVVPWKSLGQSTPLPGAKWRFNIARSRYVIGTAQHFLWSPNFQAALYGNPSNFGELTFARQ